MKVHKHKSQFFELFFLADEETLGALSEVQQFLASGILLMEEILPYFMHNLIDRR